MGTGVNPTFPKVAASAAVAGSDGASPDVGGLLDAFVSPEIRANPEHALALAAFVVVWKHRAWFGAKLRGLFHRGG